MKNFLFNQLGIRLDNYEEPKTKYSTHVNDCAFLTCSYLLNKSYPKVFKDLAKIGAKNGFSPDTEFVVHEYLEKNGYEGFCRTEKSYPLIEFLYNYKDIKCAILVESATGVAKHAFVYNCGTWMDCATNIEDGRLHEFLISETFGVYFKKKSKNPTILGLKEEMTPIKFNV